MTRNALSALILAAGCLLAACGGTSLVTGDPCHLRNGGCDPHATCTNQNGAAACDCMPGYTGDGHTCTDRDECTEAPGICAQNAYCTNTPGSFTCTCNAGYQGNDKTGSDLVCTASDPCLTANGGCDVNATCTSSGGSVTCTCNAPHWRGSGQTCSPADCATNNGGCDPNATCSGEGQNIACTCKPGYVGNGQTCMTLSCGNDNGGCDANATCSGEGAGIMCTCNSGYTGDGTKGHCAASCILPWGGTLESGQSVTGYQAASVACGSSCSSGTLTCNNGTLSGGNYQYASCSVGACAGCPAMTISFDWNTSSGPCHLDLPAGGTSDWYYTNTTDTYVGGVYADCTNGSWKISQQKCDARGSSTTCFPTGARCDGSGPASFPYPHCWTCCNAAAAGYPIGTSCP